MAKSNARAVSKLVAAVFLLGSGSVWACSTAAWLGGAVGGVAGSPPDGVARYSEFCAFQLAPEDGSAYVQSNYANDARYIARFYVLDKIAGGNEVLLFRGYGEDGATTTQFSVYFDGSDFTFDAGNGPATVAGKAGWNLVEIDWAADGDMNFWVNADAAVDLPTGTVTAGSGVIGAVRLGAPNGFNGNTGTLTFDAFESHRTTPVGPLLVCDAEGDGDLDINDVLVVVDEVFGNPAKYAGGQPDCEEDGDVDINDGLAIVDLVF